MKIRSLFGLQVLLLFCLMGVIVAYALHPVRALAYAIGGVLVAVFTLTIALYARLLKPFYALMGGMDLLREQDFSSRLAKVGQYEADSLVNLFNRLMEQLKNERLRLREQNHFLDLLVQASPMGVVITTFDHDVSALNPTARTMLGLDERQAMGKKLSALDSPLAQRLAMLPPDSTQVVRLSDATVYKCTRSSFIDHGFAHPFYLVERMTEELMRAEKKAYEKVIRMIAHEVNNSTAGTTSMLDTLQQALADEPGHEELCRLMQVCTDRQLSMSRFITRFADVVKIPAPTLLPTPLNPLIRQCAHFMEGLCAGRGIALRLNLDPAMGEADMDAALIEQVVVNILKNAAESIELRAAEAAGYGGMVTLSTHAPAEIVVADNGAGIAPEVAEKLFTPFFSTKPQGQGIGLVFIREVLTSHRCTFSLHTDADGITRFRIVFP